MPAAALMFLPEYQIKSLSVFLCVLSVSLACSSASAYASRFYDESGSSHEDEFYTDGGGECDDGSDECGTADEADYEDMSAGPERWQ